MTIDIHPLSVIRNICRRNIRILAHLDDRIFDFRLPCAGEFLDFFVEHTAVELVADDVHLPVLFRTEQISGATHLEIFQRDLDTGSELGKITDRGESFFRIFIQDFFRLIGDVGIGLAVGSSDSSFQLIQLRQTEPVTVFDDDRIYIRHIHARLDDRRADEDIRFFSYKCFDDALEFSFAHLAVRIYDPRAGKHIREHLCFLLDQVRVIKKIEDLSVALDLTKACLRDDLRIVLDDIGLHWSSVLRRFFENGDITDARQGHMQRSRYRCRGQRQHIDRVSEGLHLLFMVDAESLLFVDDHESQILRLYIFT